jgi:hypothetical protein
LIAPVPCQNTRLGTKFSIPKYPLVSKPFGRTSQLRFPIALWLARREQKLPGILARSKTYLRTPAVSRTPASLASFAALSVFSQVKSGSLRPKCPYAAVFL